MNGKVKWFNPQKGFGFITADNGNDVYVNSSCLSSQGYSSLDVGQDVEFDVEDGFRGTQAVNVKTNQNSLT